MKKILSLALMLLCNGLQSLPIETFITFREMVTSSINQTNLFIIKQFENVRDNYDPRAYYDYTPVCCHRHPWNIYATPIASIGTVHSQEHLAGYRFNMEGGIVGLDYAFLNGGVGIEADYGNFHGKAFKNFGSFDLQQAHGSLYATYFPIRYLSFDFIIGGGYVFTNLKRNSSNVGDISRSRPNASLINGLFSIEYQMCVQSFSLTPLLGIEYSCYDVFQFHEFNAPGYDIFLASQKYESYRTMVGLKLNRTFNFKSFKFIPQINILWERENSDRDRKFVIAKIGARDPQSFFPVLGNSNELFVGGVDLSLKWTNFTTNLAYEYEFGQVYLLHFFTLQLGATF